MHESIGSLFQHRRRDRADGKSGGRSGIGKSGEKLASYAPGAEIADAKLLRSADEAKSWVK